MNTPLAHSTGYGSASSLAAGAPLASATLGAGCRMGSAGLVGTSHTWPQARSSVATAASALAQSVIEVQLCGTSSGHGDIPREPFSSGLPIWVDSSELSSM